MSYQDQIVRAPEAPDYRFNEPFHIYRTETGFHNMSYFDHQPRSPSTPLGRSAAYDHISQPRKPKPQYSDHFSTSNRVPISSSIYFQQELTRTCRSKRPGPSAGRDSHMRSQMSKSPTSQVVTWPMQSSTSTADSKPKSFVQYSTPTVLPLPTPRAHIEAMDNRQGSPAASNKSSHKSDKVDFRSSTIALTTAPDFYYPGSTAFEVGQRIPPRVPELPRLPTPDLESLNGNEADFCPCCTGVKRDATRDQYIQTDLEWKMQSQLIDATAYIRRTKERHGQKRS